MSQKELCHESCHVNCGYTRTGIIAGGAGPGVWQGNLHDLAAVEGGSSGVSGPMSQEASEIVATELCEIEQELNDSIANYKETHGNYPPCIVRIASKVRWLASSLRKGDMF